MPIAFSREEVQFMAEVAPNFEERQEFWKPVVTPRPTKEPEAGTVESTCRQCGADFVIGSRFCHVCGVDRQQGLAGTGRNLARWLNLVSLRDALGQTTSSMVALILGLLCLVAAVLTGFIYTVATVLDWQAVQIWRVEWLLAAIALFLGGILLKKK